MKICWICIPLMLMSSCLWSQTKEDFVQILEALAEEPEADPLFQVELPDGRAMVLIRDLDRGIDQNRRAAEQLFYDVLNEDLTFASKPIVILSQEEAQQYGADLKFCTTIGYRISEEQADIMLTATLEGEQQYFQGAFTLRKNFSGWEVQGRNIRRR